MIILCSLFSLSRKGLWEHSCGAMGKPQFRLLVRKHWYQQNCVNYCTFVHFDQHPPSFSISHVHNVNIHKCAPHLEECVGFLIKFLHLSVFNLHMRKQLWKDLSIMHKSLLGGVYCNTLFLPLTIHARVCIILWDMPVVNYSAAHLCHSTAFNKHKCTFA